MEDVEVIVNDTLPFRVQVPKFEPKSKHTLDSGHSEGYVPEVEDDNDEGAWKCQVQQALFKKLNLNPEVALASCVDVDPMKQVVHVRAMLPRWSSPRVVVIMVRGAGRSPHWDFYPTVVDKAGTLVWYEADVSDVAVLKNVAKACVLPGHAAPRDKLHTSPFMERVLTKVVRLLKDDAVGRVILMGHSHGGLVVNMVAEALDEAWGASGRLWVVTFGSVYITPDTKVPNLAQTKCLVQFMFRGDVSLRCVGRDPPGVTWLSPPSTLPPLHRTPLHVIGTDLEWRVHSAYNVAAFIPAVAALSRSLSSKDGLGRPS